jgi:MOSC domain-containing protein YiiM
MDHPSAATLEAGLDEIRGAPADDGRVELIVRRPAVGERELLAEAQLDPDRGLVGDTWGERSSRLTPDGSPHPDMQLTLMNARVARLVAGGVERSPLAGDQLYVDLDLSETNLPAGSRLQVGSAVVEITAEPHRGCQKFTQRFGLAALRFVNSDVGGALRLRGANAKVVAAGIVRTGDAIRKLG